MKRAKIFFLISILITCGALKSIPSDSSTTLELGNSLLSLGNTYYKAGKFEQALNAYQNILKLFQHSSAVYYNIGFTLVELTRYHEAIEAFRKSLALKPDSLDTRLSLATALLAVGNYEEGWPEYEWRWERPEKKSLPMPCPRWSGQPIDGKTILLFSEGAYGDCFQFIRYAQEVKKLGATVILQAAQELKPLLSRCPYLDQIISKGETLPHLDYYTSLLSLPSIFKTTITTVPTTIPYLYADPDLVEEWRKSFTQEKKLKIGLCWQADLTNDANRPLLARRSIPLELFEQLAQLPNITLYSLQKGAHSSFEASFLHPFGSELDTDHGRFMDTAALIQNLDLVITVDTSIAHLAGALGKPTWVILPFKADWRWMTNQDDTPWYPSMKLFRKEKEAGWELVIEKIGNELEHVTNSKKVVS